MDKYKLAVTGHRPDKLGGYTKEAWFKLVSFAESELKRLQDSIEVVYTGGALGWDQAIAQACINLNIPYILCQPCDNHENKWNDKAKNYYKKIVANAKEVIVVSPGPYEAWKMQKRNEYMVDNSSVVLALWNGTGGGTANCVKYATEAKQPPRKLINCWDNYVKF